MSDDFSETQVDFYDALEALPLATQAGYSIFTCLGLYVACSKYWHDFSLEEIYTLALKVGLCKRWDSEALSQDDWLQGIFEAGQFFSSAQDLAQEYVDAFLEDSDERFSEADVDYFLLEESESDSELWDMRMQNPLLFGALCIELYRAACAKVN